MSVVCCLIVVEALIAFADYCMMNVGCCSVACCLVYVVCSSLFMCCCVLFVMCCALCGVFVCVLRVVCLPLNTLFVVCVLFVGDWELFVVRSALSLLGCL